MERQRTRILVIDDEPDLVELAAARLKGAGYEVTTATSGEEGLRILRKEAPDLILVDLIMPKLNGFELCQRLRTESRYQGIPIVVLTAAAELELAQQAIRSGADGFLVKPFDVQRLLSTIQAALDLYPVSTRKGPLVSRGTASQFLLGREFPREQLAALEKKALAKVGLRVSHELRTTLTAIRESVALLQENHAGPKTQEQLRLLGIAKRNVDRLSQFIFELLAQTELHSPTASPDRSRSLPKSIF